MDVEMFAESLKALIELNGLNNSTFAKEIGVDVRQVRRWVNAKNLPSINNLNLIAKCFDCPAQWLLNNPYISADKYWKTVREVTRYSEQLKEKEKNNEQKKRI